MHEGIVEMFRHPDFPTCNDCNNSDSAPRYDDANDSHHSESGDNVEEEAVRGNVPLLQVEGFG